MTLESKTLSQAVVTSHEVNENLIRILVSVVGTLPQEMREGLMPELAELTAKSTASRKEVYRLVAQLEAGH